MAPEIKRRFTCTLAAGLAACLASFGCAGLPSMPSQYDYFNHPAPDDQWSPKIAGWQRRERAELPPRVSAPADVSEAAPETRVAEKPGAEAAALPEAPTQFLELVETPGLSDLVDPVEEQNTLRSKYAAFRAEQKRSTARSVAAWTQDQALEHYVDDGPIDHWATLEETLRNDGDDCDGLELLTFHALRGLGFEMDEVFRAIVYRASDGQHHMVTLWFEDPHDPWVIDPTGAMTLGMPRMSELPEWVPIKLFTDATEYTVVPGEPISAPLILVADSR